MTKKSKNQKNLIKRGTKQKEQPRYDKKILMLMCGLLVIIIIFLILTTDRSRFYEGSITYITEKIEPTSAFIDIACYNHDKEITSVPMKATLKLSADFYPFVLKLYNDKVVINKFIQNFDLISNDMETYPDDCRAGNSHMAFQVTHIINGNEMVYSVTCNHKGDGKDRKSISIIMDDIGQSFKTCIENYEVDT